MSSTKSLPPLSERVDKLGITVAEIARRANVSRTTAKKYIDHGGAGPKYQDVVKVLNEAARAALPPGREARGVQAQLSDGRTATGRPLDTIFRRYATMIDGMEPQDVARVTRKLAETYKKLSKGFPDPLERYATATRLVCSWFSDDDDENDETAPAPK